MTILLAIIAGLGFGYILERGDFCFHSTWRGVFQRPQQLSLFRAYIFMMLLAIPLVQGMVALGWISPWVPPFVWQANLVGGLIFGIGMVMASSCITGLFYKLGHGMLGTLLGLAAWFVGDIIAYRGFLAGWRDSLNASAVTTAGGQSATVGNLLGPLGVIFLILLGVGAAVYLWRSPQKDRDKLWSWPLLGGAAALFTSGVWLLARTVNVDYIYGTSRVPTGVWEALMGQSGGGSLWIPVALVSLIPGALLAAWLSGTLWVRGETLGRYGELVGGGFLMGIGAGIAGGCNLGHSMIGVPLLSMGSITTTLAIIVGVFVADRVLKMVRQNAPQPAAEVG